MTQNDQASEDAPEAPTPAAAADKGTFVPLIFGGAVAAALGFFAGQTDSIEQALGLGSDPQLASTVSAQAEQISEQSSQLLAQTAELERQAETIAALTDELRALPKPEAPPDLTHIETGVAELAASFEALSTRLTELEKRPMTEGLSSEAIAAYQAELAGLKAEVDTQRAELQAKVEVQRAEIETLVEEARTSDANAALKAQLALGRAALARVIAAVDSGAPFADALGDLSSIENVSIPQDLSRLASDGVPTLAVLQAQIPDAARAALAAAREETAASGSGNFRNFVQRQLGARSVTPQDGNDPDAILSRVENAVMLGRLSDALAEAQTLPQSAQDAMADWIKLAETRHGATIAAQDLLAMLNSN